MKRFPAVRLVALLIAGLAETAARCAWDCPQTPSAIPSDAPRAQSVGATLTPGDTQ